MNAEREHLLTEYGIWTTRNGDPIPVVKMTDDHLINTIRFLRRRGETIKAVHTLEYLGISHMIMGDMARDALDSEFDRLCDAEWQDLIGEDAVRVLTDEATLRKLQWEDTP